MFGILLALHELVHVWLAEGDVIRARLQALQEVRVEPETGVLLGCVLLLGVLLLLHLPVVLLLHWGLFLPVAGSGTHHSAHCLVGNFGTRAESHSSHQSSSESGHHAAALGWLLHWLVSLGWSGCCGSC